MYQNTRMATDISHTIGVILTFKVSALGNVIFDQVGNILIT